MGQKDLLTVSEVEEVGKSILKFVWQESFQQELDCAKRPIYMNRNNIFKLKLFVKYGILRVGGRPNRANLSREVKYQKILPAKHPVTGMIIRDFL